MLGAELAGGRLGPVQVARADRGDLCPGQSHYRVDIGLGVPSRADDADPRLIHPQQPPLSHPKNSPEQIFGASAQGSVSRRRKLWDRGIITCPLLGFAEPASNGSRIRICW